MVNKVLTYTLMSFPASKAKEVLPLQKQPVCNSAYHSSRNAVPLRHSPENTANTTCRISNH